MLGKLKGGGRGMMGRLGLRFGGRRLGRRGWGGWGCEGLSGLLSGACGENKLGMRR